MNFRAHYSRSGEIFLVIPIWKFVYQNSSAPDSVWMVVLVFLRLERALFRLSSSLVWAFYENLHVLASEHGILCIVCSKTWIVLVEWYDTGVIRGLLLVYGYEACHGF